MTAEEKAIRHREAQKRWVAKNRDKFRAMNAAVKRRTRERDPEQWREKHAARTRRRLMKIDKEAAGEKPAACQVCSSTDRVCFDHSHTTQKFRGWLCHHCNLVLGHAKDNPYLLRDLADYLERHVEMCES